MISTLIINTLLSCQATKNTAEQAVVRPPDAPSEPIPATEEGTKPPPPQRPIRVESELNAKSGPIFLSMLTEYDDEGEYLCEALCYALPPATSSAFRIETCQLELNPDWPKLLEQFKADAQDAEAGKIECSTGKTPIIKGRSPTDTSPLRPPPSQKESYWVKAAREESLSVFAFAELLSFLERLSAPLPLLKSTAEAIEDEMKHAQLMLQLCAHYGDHMPSMVIPQSTSFNTEEWAVHNALAGCIGETWAAVLEGYRCQNSTIHQDIFTKIAADESKHAQLAWDIYAYLKTLLSDEANATVKQAMLDCLAQDPPFESAHDSRIASPSPAEHIQLWRHFKAEVSARLAA